MIDEYLDYTRNYKVRIDLTGDTFLATGWAHDLGYSISDPTYGNSNFKRIVNFPCLVGGSMIGSSLKLRCDLIIRSNDYSYIEVYGFDTESSFGLLTAISDLVLEFPKLKTRNESSEYISYIILSIQEETPGMINPVVTLYQSNPIRVHETINNEKSNH